MGVKTINYGYSYGLLRLFSISSENFNSYCIQLKFIWDWQKVVIN